MSLSTAASLEFIRLVGLVKNVPRTGWVNNGIANVESVADHMYRMSLIAMLACGTDTVRANRCVKMALVHDLAEGTVGDITPYDGVSKEDKHAKEVAAMKNLCENVLGGGELGSELLALWMEYEGGTSEDAILVKDIDKFEMIVQADEYEIAQGADLTQFFDSTRGKFTTKCVKDLVSALTERRDQRRAALPAGPTTHPLPSQK